MARPSSTLTDTGPRDRLITRAARVYPGARDRRELASPRAPSQRRPWRGDRLEPERQPVPISRHRRGEGPSCPRPLGHPLLEATRVQHGLADEYASLRPEWVSKPAVYIHAKWPRFRREGFVDALAGLHRGEAGLMREGDVQPMPVLSITTDHRAAEVQPPGGLSSPRACQPRSLYSLQSSSRVLPDPVCRHCRHPFTS